MGINNCYSCLLFIPDWGKLISGAALSIDINALRAIYLIIISIYTYSF